MLGPGYGARVESIFDREDFNRSLFFPRPDTSPGGEADQLVDVGGAKLHLRCHPAAARCTLLLFHGNGEVVADYDAAAAEFARIGAALAVVDYRGYGRSDGVPTLRTLIEDARPVAAAVLGDAPIVVMGRSIGGAAAHELYARPPDRVVAVVLESSFFNLGNLIRRRGLLPPREFTADERATFEPATKLAAGRLPLLVLHGVRDELIDPSEALSAIDASGSADKQLVLVPGHGHNDINLADDYWRALGRFIDSVVKTP